MLVRVGSHSKGTAYWHNNVFTLEWDPTRTNMRNQTAIIIPEPNKRNQAAALVPDPVRRTQTASPEAGKRTQTTVLISEPNKMYCDLLNKAFYVVRNRFQLLPSPSPTPETLPATS